MPDQHPVHVPALQGLTLQLWLTPEQADAVSARWNDEITADYAYSEALALAWEREADRG
jgi:hypothetical protein